MLKITRLNKASDFDKVKETRQEFVDFLYESLGKYGDAKEDINKCIEYALSENPAEGGTIYLAFYDEKLAGGVIMNNTGMSGYIPENILVYIAVGEKFRGKGIGKQLVQEVIKNTKGDIKLHVEYDNPAIELYKKLGFETKYAEMRLKN
ncbi:GNAT family N-acetyltransferase [Brumimicrobium salinarum]|uniref:GNAT family N-acetyltransferase n=1 Tax=Brumimicrobium salinarum TaxID=2058658 RepID=A0A2I0R2P2_9FLAO|nr:GNAT family N-acetyltransferase [Brumimicrobium salinarum]PKR80825.1 GNAT family N-acetyltransferase [Brumimicrobium salinarum]